MQVNKTLFTWSGGPRSSGVSFFCFVSPRAWKQKKPTPLDRGPPLHVNRPLDEFEKKFSWVLSHDLTWENKTNKLERSIMRKGVFLVSRKQTFQCMRGRDNLFCKSFKWNLTLWKKTDIQKGSSVWRYLAHCSLFSIFLFRGRGSKIRPLNFGRNFVFSLFVFICKVMK